MTEELLKTYVGKYVQIQTIIGECVGFLGYTNNRFYICGCGSLPYMTLKTLVDYRDVTCVHVIEEEK